MKLSIIIVNHNTSQLLFQCLNSLVSTTQNIEKEIIVVDNFSKDDSVNMVREKFPQLKLIENKKNYGFAFANNQAVGIANSNLILLLNSDTIILENTIQKTIDFIEQDKDAHIVGCKLLNSDFSLQNSCRSFPTLWNIFTESFFLYKLFPKTKLFGKYHMTYFDYNSVLKVDVVKGAFMLIKKNVIEQIGLFDGKFFMYSEETDFCYRANKNNFNTIFFPDASIVHIGGGSIQSNQIYFEQIHFSQILFIKKHYKNIYKYLCIFIKVIGILLRVPIYFFYGFISIDKNLIKKSKRYFMVFMNSIFLNK